MNLDQWEKFGELDQGDMLAEIEGLPVQLESAWALGQDMPLHDPAGIGNVVLAGMGGSAIGADLIHAFSLPQIQVLFLC